MWIHMWIVDSHVEACMYNMLKPIVCQKQTKRDLFLEESVLLGLQFQCTRFRGSPWCWAVWEIEICKNSPGMWRSFTSTNWDGVPRVLAVRLRNPSDMGLFQWNYLLIAGHVGKLHPICGGWSSSSNPLAFHSHFHYTSRILFFFIYLILEFQHVTWCQCWKEINEFFKNHLMKRGAWHENITLPNFPLPPTPTLLSKAQKWMIFH